MDPNWTKSIKISLIEPNRTKFSKSKPTWAKLKIINRILQNWRALRYTNIIQDQQRFTIINQGQPIYTAQDYDDKYDDDD